jgi:hypothetical protein
MLFACISCRWLLARCVVLGSIGSVGAEWCNDPLCSRRCAAATATAAHLHDSGDPLLGISAPTSRHTKHQQQQASHGATQSQTQQDKKQPEFESVFYHIGRIQNAANFFCRFSSRLLFICSFISSPSLLVGASRWRPSQVVPPLDRFRASLCRPQLLRARKVSASQPWRRWSPAR